MRGNLYKFIKSLTVCIISTTALSGCATLSKDDCLLGDWRAIGYKDGVLGHYPDRLNAHAKACSRVDVSPNKIAWEQGRQEGLRQYCTKTNAYQLGKRGLSLNAVCPIGQVQELQRVHSLGLTYYQVSNQVTEYQNNLSKYQQDYEKLKNGDMLNFKTEKEAREYLLTLKDKINQTQRLIDSKKQQLADMQWQQGF